MDLHPYLIPVLVTSELLQPTPHPTTSFFSPPLTHLFPTDNTSLHTLGRVVESQNVYTEYCNILTCPHHRKFLPKRLPSRRELINGFFIMVNMFPPIIWTKCVHTCTDLQRGKHCHVLCVAHVEEIGYNAIYTAFSHIAIFILKMNEYYKKMMIIIHTTNIM